MYDIDYPYMPEGRELRYVAADHPFMQAAALARKECAGDPSYPVGIVLVKNGEVVARAGNLYNRGPGQIHVCKRIVHEPPSGTGYDLCDQHDSPGHSERMVIQVAKEQGIDVSGCDAYMYGHWWCCEPCWDVMIENGIRDVYVVDDAHERFHRDVIYPEMLQPSVSSIYLAGAYTHNTDIEGEISFHERLRKVANEFDIDSCLPYVDNPENKKPWEERDRSLIYSWTKEQVIKADVLVAEVSQPSLGCGGELVMAAEANKLIVILSKKGLRISNFCIGNPAIVYHIEYEDEEDACKQFRNVLKQL